MRSSDGSLDDLEARLRVKLGVAPSGQTRPRGPAAPRAHTAASPARHRFVKDGEVPTTLLVRGSEDNQLVPTRLRLEETTRRLAAETSLRQELERRLETATARLQSSQAQISSLEIARDEAVTAARAAVASTIVTATPEPARSRRGRPPGSGAKRTAAPLAEDGDDHVPVKWWQGD